MNEDDATFEALLEEYLEKFREGTAPEIDDFSHLHPEYAELKPEQQKHIFDSVQHVVRKCAHFTEYMILGFMIRLCLESWFGHRVKRSRSLTLAGFCVGTVYACTDEFHQLLIEGRSGQWSDVFVDGSGVLLGVLIGMLLIRRISRRNAKQE